MKIDIKDPSKWSHVLITTVLEFEAKVPRKVQITVNTTQPATFWVADNPEMKQAVLLANVNGLAELSFTVQANAYVEARSKAGAIIYMKGHAPSQAVASSEIPSFTNIEPRGRPTEMQRMMYQMKLNERKRDQALKHDQDIIKSAEVARLAAIKAERVAFLAEKEAELKATEKATESAT